MHSQQVRGGPSLEAPWQLPWGVDNVPRCLGGDVRFTFCSSVIRWGRASPCEFFVGVTLPRGLTLVWDARPIARPCREEMTHATKVREKMDRRWRCRYRVGGKFSDR